MNAPPPGLARLVLFLALAALLTGLLVLYAISQRRPLIPADRDHAGPALPEQCLPCHGPGRPDARGPNHPLNDQCFNCHERS